MSEHTEYPESGNRRSETSIAPGSSGDKHTGVAGRGQGGSEPVTEGQVSDHHGIVVARGTEEGLILRIDGKAEWSDILAEIDAFLGGKRRFFSGGEVSVEWLEQLPTKEQSTELEKFLKDNFGMKIAARRKKLGKFLRTAGGSLTATSISERDALDRDESSTGDEDGRFEDGSHEFLGAGPGGSMLSRGSSDPHVESLLEKVERIASGECGDPYSTERGFGNRANRVSGGGRASGLYGRESDEDDDSFVERITEILGAELLADEEANSRIIFGTLRSGQRVETPFSLVVVGDVNPGADLIAGGDIFVLGSLRGTAHAGAYDDDTVERMIMALQMQPMQLRIGSVVSRGVSEAGVTPEVARIDSRTIIVEPYNAKVSGAKASGLKKLAGKGKSALFGSRR